MSRRGPPHRNSRHSSPRLLITTLDLSRWRTILFRHCTGNLAPAPQTYLTFAYRFLPPEFTPLYLSALKSPRTIYAGSLCIFRCGNLFLRDLYSLIGFNYVCVCVCVHLASNEPMFATGHGKWCVTLVTAGYDGIFSLWVTGPTRHSLSGLLFFFLPFVCVCVVSCVFVWVCVTSLCVRAPVCVCVCVCVES